jgi:hypothetical protein
MELSFSHLYVCYGPLISSLRLVAPPCIRPAAAAPAAPTEPSRVAPRPRHPRTRGFSVALRLLDPGRFLARLSLAYLTSDHRGIIRKPGLGLPFRLPCAASLSASGNCRLDGRCTRRAPTPHEGHASRVPFPHGRGASSGRSPRRRSLAPGSVLLTSRSGPGRSR